MLATARGIKSLADLSERYGDQERSRNIFPVSFRTILGWDVFWTHEAGSSKRGVNNFIKGDKVFAQTAQAVAMYLARWIKVAHLTMRDGMAILVSVPSKPTVASIRARIPLSHRSKRRVALCWNDYCDEMACVLRYLSRKESRCQFIQFSSVGGKDKLREARETGTWALLAAAMSGVSKAWVPRCFRAIQLMAPLGIKVDRQSLNPGGAFAQTSRAKRSTELRGRYPSISSEYDSK